MQYIRDHYNVPAKRGMRVRYTHGGVGEAREGVIIRAEGQYLRIRFGDDNKSDLYHPTWAIEYLIDD